MTFLRVRWEVLESGIQGVEAHTTLETLTWFSPPVVTVSRGVAVGKNPTSRSHSWHVQITVPLSETVGQQPALQWRKPAYQMLFTLPHAKRPNGPCSLHQRSMLACVCPNVTRQTVMNTLCVSMSGVCARLRASRGGTQRQNFYLPSHRVNCIVLLLLLLLLLLFIPALR
ncbi:unnamed protein product [Schistocephalus solidus]|uniref:Secreted protein n=1 Tax=Schistocephalus solidus TaxID=70667 RepID=A0A183SH86_SCHSO|nr:unnamed protein product [Schistocephalus solidus]